MVEGTKDAAILSHKNCANHKHLKAGVQDRISDKDKKILTTAVPETQLSGFTVVRTDNPKGTASFLLQFTRRMCLSPKLGCRNLNELLNDIHTPKVSFQEFNEALNPKDALGRSSFKNVTARVFNQIKGIARDTVPRIIEKYPSMRSLYESLNTNDKKDIFIEFMGNEKVKCERILSTFTRLY